MMNIGNQTIHDGNQQFADTVTNKNINIIGSAINNTGLLNLGEINGNVTQQK